MIANHVSSHLPKTPINRDTPILQGEIEKHLEVLNLCWNQVPKPPRTSRTSILEYEEHSKQIHSSHPSRSQSSLELSSKAPINTKGLQISEAL